MKPLTRRQFNTLCMLKNWSPEERRIKSANVRTVCLKDNEPSTRLAPAPESEFPDEETTLDDIPPPARARPRLDIGHLAKEIMDGSKARLLCIPYASCKRKGGPAMMILISIKRLRTTVFYDRALHEQTRSNDVKSLRLSSRHRLKNIVKISHFADLSSANCYV